MELFDVLLSLGRTNRAVARCPCTESEALATMDRCGVSEALVFHTHARDYNPDAGNRELDGLRSDRLHRILAFEPAFAKRRSPEAFLNDALERDAKAVLVNPAMREIRIDRSVRILELAALLETRRIPLIAAYRRWDGSQDIIDWYHLADFCSRFPKLPVIAWQKRSRSNRPMFDALATAPNLRVVLSSLWQSQMVECVCETFGHERLLFSMGLPGLHPSSFQAVLSYAEIGDEARQAIASGNIKSLMREASYDR